MLGRKPIDKLDDIFLNLRSRPAHNVYFIRIAGYNEEVHNFVAKYYEAARQRGVIIEGKLKNPDNNNLAYYNEIMGPAFQTNPGFISASLKKWLPRMNDVQRRNVTDAINATLMSLRSAGKNDNMLKNAYVKFMCWLYYKFERIANQLGDDSLPKILYEGEVGNYDLLLLNVLSIAGCDIVLLELNGDSNYLKVDPSSSRSDLFQMNGMVPFPEGFSLARIRQEKKEELERERLYGEKPHVVNCTNAWITGEPVEDIRKDILLRGNDPNLFYNCFFRIAGVEDKLFYATELFKLNQDLKAAKRRIVVIDERIDPPTMDEIREIRRNNYQRIEQLIMDLMRNIQFSQIPELHRLMRKAFVDVILMENRKGTDSLNKMTGKAVHLLCWLKRYQNMLFAQWKMPEVSCFFYMGGCRDENEALFCRFLARLPVDVVLFCPNLNRKCCLEDNLLFEKVYTNSLPVTSFPQEESGVSAGTAAYHAERELDTLMYQDTGIYRNQQFAKATSISLQTMYEEIPGLWDQELKYRPNFSTAPGMANIPVIYSKICGVKDGNKGEYWQSIKKLIVDDTIVIKKVPVITGTTANPIKPYATEFYKNGRLQRERIKSHKAYQYAILRESMQDHLLDKLHLLLEQKVIKGTFENGTEYTVIATALNLDKPTIRLLQKFDFTKKNPKLIYIITGETMLSLEDSIYAAFLNLVGFDIIFFVPTGYKCIERYFNNRVCEEHQIGEYLYDLQVPDFDSIVMKASRQSLMGWIFKRGT